MAVPGRIVVEAVLLRARWVRAILDRHNMRLGVMTHRTRMILTGLIVALAPFSAPWDVLQGAPGRRGLIMGHGGVVG